MTGNTRQDPSAGRATGDAAMRGALLVGVAVVIGALLLWRGHDDGGTALAQQTTGTTPAVTTTVGAPAVNASGATAATGKTGATGAATEKQLFDCLLITKDNVDKYTGPFTLSQ